MKPDAVLVLALADCNLRYQSWEQRFIRALRDRINAGGGLELTPGRAGELRRIAWTYRVQLEKKGLVVPAEWRPQPVAIESPSRLAELQSLKV